MLAKFVRLTALETYGFCKSLRQVRMWQCEFCPPFFSDSPPAQPLSLPNRNFPALPTSAVSARLLLQSKMGDGAERHLLSTTLIVRSTKHFSQANSASQYLWSSLWKLCSCWILWGWRPWFSSPPFLLCIYVNTILAIPRAVLVSNPSLWTNTCVNRKLTFFLGRIFKEWI